MIKTALYIILFSVFANVASFIKLDRHAKTGNEKLTNQNDPLKIFIQSLTKSPNIKIPYGSKSVLNKFSAEWEMPSYKNTSKDKAIQNLQSNYDCLDSFFYADKEKRNQINVEVKNTVAPKIASANFVKSDEGLHKYKKIIAKVSSLTFSNSFKTYSIIISGKQKCNNCEFPNSQTENVLINVDAQNNIIDKLVVSYIVGSDLGGSSKFFYIDANKIIHIKEFYSDELTAGFKKYKKYKVTPDGHFIENTKK